MRQTALPTVEHDVLVVGAGPAGLTTAITLARHGVDVLLVDKHRGTSPFPKATAASTRTMEILRSWGIEQPVRDGAMTVEPFMAMSETLSGPARMTVPFGYPTPEQALAVSPTRPAAVPQDRLEPVLRDHLLHRGGRLGFGLEVTAVSIETDGAVLTEVTETASGLRHRIRSRYVVGADGPRSLVRRAAGIGIDDLGTVGDFVAVTFRADLTRRLGRAPSAINAVDITGAEGMFVPTSTDDRWIYARELAPGSGETVADFTPERVLALLRAGTGIADLTPRVLTTMPFTMGGHVATSFRAGPVFVVGDAAHRTTPVGGTGMNTAIHAAHNLGWKLAWVLRGWAGDALLDSYEAERRPVGGDNVRRSMQRGPQPPVDGLALDLGVPYSSPVLDHADGAGVGRRAPHAWVRQGGATRSMLDLFDGRLTLVTGPEDARWVRAAALVTGPGPERLPLHAVVVGRDVVPLDRTLQERYGLGPSTAVLVRPDGYLAWRRDDDHGDLLQILDAAVHTVLGQEQRRLVMAG